jgi:ABC-2 type transport system permease protein
VPPGITRRPLVTRLLRWLGINPGHYAVLLDLFSTLSERQEFIKGRAEFSRNIFVGISATMTALVNLVAVFVGRPPLHTFVVFNYAGTCLILLVTFVAEAVNTFLNPVEMSVLAHQPIKDRSYSAAKITYLATIVAWIVLPLNLAPAVLGLHLQEAQLFFPVLYLLASYLLGLFAALLICALIGVLLRLLPPAKLRSIASWMQASMFLMIFLGPRAAGALFRYSFIPAVAVGWANPLNWFVAIATIGQESQLLRLDWTAGLAMSVCGVFLIFGIRSLSEDYMTKVHLLLRSGPKPRRFSRGWLGAIVRLLSGRPSGRAAFSFIYAMARTDWHFRSSALPMLIQFAILPIVGIARGLGPSPFNSVRPTGAHLLPHVGGLACLSLCVMLTYSDQHKAAWIFLTAPLESIRSFVRGIFWSLFLPLSIVAFLLLPLYVHYWGIRDAVLFLIYSLCVSAFYVSVELFLVDGLPFSNPPQRSSGFLAAPLVFAALIGAGIIVVLQWLFIFQDRFVALGASMIFAGLAYLIARVSLRNVEVNVLHNLHVIASGRMAMFKEVE